MGCPSFQHGTSSACRDFASPETIAILKPSTQRDAEQPRPALHRRKSKTTNTYNLLDQPWLTVADQNDNQTSLGIIDTFKQAAELKGIEGDDVAQKFALHRLLIAIITRAYKDAPLDRTKWNSLYDNGPDDTLFDYLERYRDRFDLLDDKRPFFQTAVMRKPNGDGPDGLSRLILDLPNTDQVTSYRLGVTSISFAEAARWVVAAQAYDTSGNKPRMEGDNRSTGGNVNASGTGWTGCFEGILIHGDNLWHTLMLNTVGRTDTEPHDNEPYDIENDKPVWELEDPEVVGGKKGYDFAKDGFHKERLHGPATLMTWQARRIKLAHDGEKVTGVTLATGDRINSCDASGIETMARFRENLQKGTLYPVAPKPELSLWRSFPTFLRIDKQNKPVDAPEDTGKKKKKPIPQTFRPMTIDWVKSCGKKIPVTIEGIGAIYCSTQSSKIEEFTDSKINVQTGILLNESTDFKTELSEAMERLGKWVYFLKILCNDLANASGLRIKTRDYSVAELNAKRAWSGLETEFDNWLIKQPDAETASENLPEFIENARLLIYRMGLDLYSGSNSKTLIGRISPDGYVSASTAWSRFSYNLRKEQ